MADVSCRTRDPACNVDGEGDPAPHQSGYPRGEVGRPFHAGNTWHGRQVPGIIHMYGLFEGQDCPSSAALPPDNSVSSVECGRGTGARAPGTPELRAAAEHAPPLAAEACRLQPATQPGEACPSRHRGWAPAQAPVWTAAPSPLSAPAAASRPAQAFVGRSAPPGRGADGPPPTPDARARDPALAMADHAPALCSATAVQSGGVARAEERPPWPAELQAQLFELHRTLVQHGGGLPPHASESPRGCPAQMPVEASEAQLLQLQESSVHQCEAVPPRATETLQGQAIPATAAVPEDKLQQLVPQQRKEAKEAFDGGSSVGNPRVGLSSKQRSSTHEGQQRADANAAEPLCPKVRGFEAQFFKTSLCTFWLENKCMRRVCRFAHGEGELRNAPDLTKTSMCRSVLRGGRCTQPNCRYAHALDEVRATSIFFKTRMCAFYLAGFCKLGGECRFAHDVRELRALDRCVPATHADSAEAFANGGGGEWGGSSSSSSAAPPTPHPQAVPPPRMLHAHSNMEAPAPRAPQPEGTQDAGAGERPRGALSVDVPPTTLTLPLPTPGPACSEQAVETAAGHAGSLQPS